MNATTLIPRLFNDPNRSARPEIQTHAPLPMTPEEVEKRGWDEVDVVFVTGDAYVDSPSFANGLLARVLEKDGFKVAVLSQPDWNSADDFRKFGRPKVAFCVSAGNMDSMINHYTANRKVRNDDAYSPGGKIGRRPDRATLAYCQRAREAFPGVPVIAGGVEASLRRIVHYDYWSDKVRRSILMDAKPDLLIYGMGERPLLTILRRLYAGEEIQNIRDVRGTVYKLGKTEDLPEESETIAHLPSYEEVAEVNERLEIPKEVKDPEEIRELTKQLRNKQAKEAKKAKLHFVKMTQLAFENLNPYRAKTLIQEHGEEAIVVNPPDFPLTEEDMDDVYSLPFTRKAHPSYTEPIPAVEVVKSSVLTHRGCFGGCSFCAITAHQGKIIQSRSEKAIVEEIRSLAKDAGGNYVVSDLNAPTANMYRLGGKNQEACKQCIRTSCLCPEICPNLNVDQTAYRELMRQAREVEGVKNVLIASGIRTDLANFSPEFINDLAKYHTGGHLKTAPEHVDDYVLSLMNKPPIANYEHFCELFAEVSRKNGKEQYLVPYLIAGFPGCKLEAMVEVAEYLKKNDIRPEQVQDFIPAPFQLATCAYYTGIDPISEQPVYVPKGLRERRLQHALLLYYSSDYYHDVKSALKEVHREDLIGHGENALIPPFPSKSVALRRTSRVRKYVRDEQREAKEKEERRIQAEELENENRSFGGKRVGRERQDSNGGYRQSAREFGSRYTNSKEWDPITKTWKRVENQPESDSRDKGRNSRGGGGGKRNFVRDHDASFGPRAHTNDRSFRPRHERKFNDKRSERPFVSVEEGDSFRRRNKSEGEDFQKDRRFDRGSSFDESRSYSKFGKRPSRFGKRDVDSRFSRSNDRFENSENGRSQRSEVDRDSRNEGHKPSKSGFNGKDSKRERFGRKDSFGGKTSGFHRGDNRGTGGFKGGRKSGGSRRQDG